MDAALRRSTALPAIVFQCQYVAIEQSAGHNAETFRLHGTLSHRLQLYARGDCIEIVATLFEQGTDSRAQRADIGSEQSWLDCFKELLAGEQCIEFRVVKPETRQLKFICSGVVTITVGLPV